MAGEFKHAVVGSDLDQTEWESIDAHVLDSGALGDLIYHNGTRLVRLPAGSVGYRLTVVAGVPTWSNAIPLQLPVTLTDAVTAAVSDVLILSHDSSGTAATGFATGLLFRAQDSTTADQDAARIQARWTTATHASRASALDFQTLTAAGSLTTQVTITDTGNLSFASTGQRITGDTGNATHSSRLLLRNSVTDVGTALGIVPNGTATAAQVNLYNAGNPDASAFVRLRVSGTTADITALNNSGSLPTTFSFAGFTSGYSFDQGVTISNPTSSNSLVITNAAATIRRIVYQTSGTFRWGLQTDSDAESGSNAGSTFYLKAYDDSGTLIGNALQVTRATMAATFGGLVTFARNSNGNAAWTAVPATGTNASFGTFTNTGGTMYVGRDDSAGGQFGGTAYAGAIWVSGAYPLILATNGAERMRVDSSGNLAQVGGIFSIGGMTARGTTNPTNAINLFNGTAPVGTLTNGATFYAASGEMRVMDSSGNSTLLSPHDDEGNWVFDSVDTVTGRHLRIDVEKLLRALNTRFGYDFVHLIQE